MTWFTFLTCSKSQYFTPAWTAVQINLPCFEKNIDHKINLWNIPANTFPPYTLSLKMHFKSFYGVPHKDTQHKELSELKSGPCSTHQAMYPLKGLHWLGGRETFSLLKGIIPCQAYPEKKWIHPDNLWFLWRPPIDNVFFWIAQTISDSSTNSAVCTAKRKDERHTKIQRAVRS